MYVLEEEHIRGLISFAGFRPKGQNNSKMHLGIYFNSSNVQSIYYHGTNIDQSKVRGY